METRRRLRKTQRFPFALGVALAMLGLLAPLRAPAADRPPRTKVGEYQVSGPYTQENLTIYLIHGKDALTGTPPLLLQEALKQKKVVIRETGQVNELTIENVSSDAEVFAQSGDVIKGGQQDRFLAGDLLLRPRSGKVPVACYCVESGRWEQRGAEAKDHFSSSPSQLASKGLRLAGGQFGQFGGQVGGGLQLGGGLGAPGGGFGALSGGLGALGGGLGAPGGGSMAPVGQAAVWSEVVTLQRKLQAAVGDDVRAKESESSLELTLEDKKVREGADKYIRKLSAIVTEDGDATGFVFAINGRLNGGDVYASKALFQKLWPKLLDAAAVEALAESAQDEKYEPIALDAIKACLLDSEKGDVQEKEVAKRVKVRMRETDKYLFFETRDGKRKGLWIHRSYLTK